MFTHSWLDGIQIAHFFCDNDIEILKKLRIIVIMEIISKKIKLEFE